jgi:FdhE protein
MTIAASIDGLRRQRPEWQPWLAVVDEVVRDAANAAWESAVPELAAAPDRGVPLLDGCTIALPTQDAGRLLDRLARAASRGGAPHLASAACALRDARDVLAVFGASLGCNDQLDITPAARSQETDAGIQAILPLLAVPLLHACNRRLSSSVPDGWTEGYCPVCGSWPVFAEVRGIERSRYLRCGRCGGEWFAHALRCAYCGMSDHDELVALVPEDSGGQATVEACRRCLGYLKAFTRLQGCPPDAVMLEDLATVDLDVVALTNGFTKPADAGRRLRVRVRERGSRSPRRFFAFNG